MRRPPIVFKKEPMPPGHRFSVSVLLYRFLRNVKSTIFHKFPVLILIYLDIPVQHPDKSLVAQLVDQFADRNPCAADNRAQLVLGIMYLQLVPAAVDEPFRIRRGAEQPFQAVLTGVERQILDLMAQNQHLFQNIFHNGVCQWYN